jgi:hypothetical protein
MVDLAPNRKKRGRPGQFKDSSIAKKTHFSSERRNETGNFSSVDSVLPSVRITRSHVKSKIAGQQRENFSAQN